MTESQQAPTEESLRTQLVEVHFRATTHANRIWQLPFSYIGIIGLSFSIIGNSPSEWTYLLFVLYAIMGVLVFVTMLGAIEGVRRALTHMIRIEEELHLTQTTRIRLVLQYLPYYLIAMLGFISCVVAAFLFWHHGRPLD